MKYEQILKSNLHTHTTYCDGKQAPEEIVLAAIEAGMDTIGFSEHAHFPSDALWSMSLEDTEKYRQEVLRLKKQYADQIHILLGIEADYFSIFEPSDYEYVIGSVHYMIPNGELVAVDFAKDSLLDGIRRHYNNDVYQFAEQYYEKLAQVKDKTHCDIVGHFDLLTKHNQNGDLIDESNKRYLTAAFDALDALAKQGAIFEINTGAMSRGYRTTPYPSPILLRRMLERGAKITISSDAHDKAHILYAFSDAAELAKSVGYSSVLAMTRDGWQEVPI